MRKMASVREISDLQPIDGADAIEVAVVDGWKVVVKKGEFKVGDLAVYLEIDSWVPHELAPFLSKGQEPREYNGVRGERLKTVKLRGQISQGLLLSIEDVFPGADRNFWWSQVGVDISDTLGVQKWERELSANIRGIARGNFPTHLVPKTDQERIQNCFRNVEKRCSREDLTFEVTMKLDGSSMTVFKLDDGELRVCSRNMELKVDWSNHENAFVKAALEISDRLVPGYAFQGELMGPGIQGNRENFKDFKFFVFDIWNINELKYVEPANRRAMCILAGLEHVPVISEDKKILSSVDDFLEMAEGPSINNNVREGIVWKCNQDPSFSFKAISNKFLLKGGD